jgi:hypothetical protein
LDVSFVGLEVEGEFEDEVLLPILMVITIWDICISSTSSSYPSYNPKEISKKN